MIRNNLMPENELKKVRPLGFGMRITALVLAVATLWLGISIYMLKITTRHYEQELDYIEEHLEQIPDGASSMQQLQNALRLLEQERAGLLTVLEMPGLIQGKDAYEILLHCEDIAPAGLWVLNWALSSKYEVSMEGISTNADALQDFMIRLQGIESVSDVLLVDMKFVNRMDSRFIHFDLLVSH